MITSLEKRITPLAIFIILTILFVGFMNIQHQKAYMQQRVTQLNSQILALPLAESQKNTLLKQLGGSNILLAQLSLTNSRQKFNLLFYFGLTTLVLTFFIFFRQIQHHILEYKQHSDTLLSENLQLNQKAKEREIELESHLLLSKFTEKVPTILFRLEMDATGKMTFPFLSKGIENLIPKKELLANLTNDASLGFSMVHPEDAQYLMESLQKSYHNLSDWEITYRNVWADNEIHWMKGYAKPESRENGIVTWYGYLDDVTEYKKQEQALQKLNEDLINSNEELEKFAYIASHDLQEPLRMISSFLGLLEQDCGDNISSAGKQYLNFAAEGTVRMKRIMDDLLEYSKVGKQNYKLEEINLNELLKEVVLLNNVLIKEKNALIEWGELPIIQGGKTHIQQVFHNLIGNALKYQKPNTQPIIKITSKELDNHWQFSVEDNGIGIEEKHFEKVFVVFQRLHTRKEYAGTGIGLSICKKIVENHQGQMWINSKKDEGSTFHFTLAKT